MSVITLPSNGGFVQSFEMQRSQDVLTTMNGVDVITSYPDRRWVMTLEIRPQQGANLRAWALALEQLSDMNNVFAYGPKAYTGPSTGYAGASPLVNGANQLGSTINLDGVSFSTAILNSADFISWDVTSAGGSTNRQLIRVTANVISNGSGQCASVPLNIPIRQAPADNATVNITTPTAFFRFQKPRGGYTNLDVMLRAGLTIDAIERVFP